MFDLLQLAGDFQCAGIKRFNVLMGAFLTIEPV